VARESQAERFRSEIVNINSHPGLRAEASRHKGRLLLLSQVFYPEMIGTGKTLTELAIGLGELGWNCHVICAQPAVLLGQENQQVPAVLEHKGVTIRRSLVVGKHRGGLFGRLLFGASFMISSFFQALKAAGRCQAILVVTNPPFLGLAAILVKWLRGTPYINIVHDVYPDTAVAAGLLRETSPITFLWERVTRLILRGAAANIVLGRDMEKLIRAKLGASYQGQVVLVQNWADPNVVPVPRERNTFRQRYNPQDYFLVQYSGTMARIHNVEPLVEAAELLRDEPILFQFIGSGFKRPVVEKWVREKQLQNVQLLPFQPEEKLAEVLSAADLAAVCLAPGFTGSSVPGKSYGILAAAVPILALVEADSEVGLTVREGDCGIVIPNASGQEVASAIRNLAKDRQKAQALGRNGLALNTKRFAHGLALAKYDKAFLEAFRPGRAEIPQLAGNSAEPASC
jgi:glycosyltransferase involved in cell wall biosynthesis